MVTIYKIGFTSEVKWIIPSEEGFLHPIERPFDGRPRSQHWGFPDFYVHGDPDNLATDFFSMAGGTIAFTEKVMKNEYIAAHFEMAGEILPVQMEHGPLFYVLNVTEMVNPLNQSECEYFIYPDGTKGRILKYSFHPNRFSEASVFKIPETKKVDILTLYREGGSAEDYFYPAYQESGLKGLKFEKLWSDSEE